MRTGPLLKAAIYARVSKADKQTPENQLAQLRAFAATQAWTVHREYVDRESAKSADRPQFKRMFEAAGRHEFDVLLFWSLDRLSREGALQTLQHLNRLTSCGIQFRSFTEQYLDSCGVFREAVISILAVIAKQERIRLSERTRAGLARARHQGKTIGRPRAIVDLAQLERLHAEGLSTAEIARRLGISSRTVKRQRSAHENREPSLGEVAIVRQNPLD